MSAYQYAPLPAHATRLLQLLPEEDPQTIRCKIFEFPLRNNNAVFPSYEALSYVWGDQARLRTIYVDGRTLKVTENLYLLLLRLQPRYVPRVIWVDAICIDQTNNQDKANQIPLMAEIYAIARSVLVWLGGTGNDGGAEALDIIRRAGDGSQNLDPESYQRGQQAVLRLLQRPWFRRIWVLQEVAAARHISIMCGPEEIDGHAFSVGVDAFDISTTQVTFLIRRAIFRSRQILRDLDRISLNISSLSELVDMYHPYEATILQDKVYALLGLCVDNLENSGLRPDYAVTWQELMVSLVKFILGGQTPVHVPADKEIAIIKTTGHILGKVCHVETSKTLSGWITKTLIKSTSEQLKVIGNDSGDTETRCNHRRHTAVNLPQSAISVQKGDLVCLLQGSSKPTIIRLRGDHFIIVIVAAAIRIEYRKPIEGIVRARTSSVSRCVVQSFSLLWDWKLSLQDPNSSSSPNSVWADYWDSLEKELPRQLRDVVRIWNAAHLLEDSEEYNTAGLLLQEAAKCYEASFGELHPEVLKVPRGCSFLSWAARGGEVETVKVLLESKVEVERKDRLSHRSPLSWACEHGHKAIVEQLLGVNKVEVDSRDIDGRTPLSWACENGHQAVVEQLIITGKANVEVTDRFRRTSLSWAAANGHDNVVKQLLKSNANADLKDKYGRTPRSYAALYLHNSIVELLDTTDKVWVDLQSGYDETLLSYAAEYGHRSIVNRILETRSACIESKARDGHTPLAWAAANGHEAIVRLLLEARANFESRVECYDRTPLVLAARYGHGVVVNLLLEAKAELESKDKYRRTPLASAARHGHEVAVNLLLEAKAELESEDGFRRTPLALAAELGHEAVVRLLLEAKANTESKDDYGHTPLALAAENGHEAVLKLLLGVKADLESEDDYGRTPLALAAENGREAVLKLLLGAKADLESKDKIGRTPLALAAENGHEAVVKLLLEAKSEIQSEDQYCRTSLALAAKSGHEAVVRLLLENKADLESGIIYDRKPLTLASRNGHEIIVKLLLEAEADLESKREDR